LQDAIAKLFPGFNTAVGDIVGSDSGTPTEPGTTPEPDPTASPTDLLEQADKLFAEADAALKAGSLADYEAKTRQARDLVAQALELLQAATS
jgi:hypothetical protein